MTNTDRQHVSIRIADFLLRRNWLPGGADCPAPQVRFLAAGEYNENHLVRCGDTRFVFRINHGSQLGLTDQISYEYEVLCTVAASGITPRPLQVEPHAADFGGVLLMEYLPGSPLDYRRNAQGAARAFARIHALPTSGRLMVQATPVADIAEESIGLIRRYPEHPLRDVRRLLEHYHEQVLRLGEETDPEFAREPFVTANTEVNSGNFLVHDDTVRLVDWEKAVTTCRYQDLGHFLVPTTTLWKTDYRFGPEERLEFLRAYSRFAGLDTPLDELSHKTDVLERTILLRALSWCYMAYYEYTSSDRPLKNNDTFATISRYMNEAECFLKPRA